MKALIATLTILLLGCGSYQDKYDDIAATPLSFEQKEFRKALAKGVIHGETGDYSIYDGAVAGWSWNTHIQDLIVSGHRELAKKDLTDICDHMPIGSYRYNPTGGRIYIVDARISIAIGMLDDDSLRECQYELMNFWEPNYRHDLKEYRNLEGKPLPYNINAQMALALWLLGDKTRAMDIINEVVRKILPFWAHSPNDVTPPYEPEDLTHGNLVLQAIKVLRPDVHLYFLYQYDNVIKPVDGPLSSWGWCENPTAKQEFIAQLDGRWDSVYRQFPHRYSSLGYSKTMCLGVK